MVCRRLGRNFQGGFASVNALDDFFDGFVLDEKIANFDGAEDLADEVGRSDLGAVEADAEGQLIHLVEMEAIARKGGDATGFSAVFQHELDLLRAQQPFFQLIERAIVEDAAVIDDHDAAAKLLDIVEIVSGEQNGGVKLAIDGAQELADVVLGNHVEANGRLIEKEERGIVQQCRGQIAAHAFAERKFAHGSVQVIANAEDFVEALHARVEILLRYIVNAAQKLERFDHGNVPPKLGALAEHHADGFHILRALAKGDESVDDNFAAGRNKNAGEHFDGRGFARAIRSDVADHFAAFDGETDTVHGGHGAILADEKILNRAQDSFAAMEGAKVFGEIADMDERAGGHEHKNSNICGRLLWNRSS